MVALAIYQGRSDCLYPDDVAEDITSIRCDRESSAIARTSLVGSMRAREAETCQAVRSCFSL